MRFVQGVLFLAVYLLSAVPAAAETFTFSTPIAGDAVATTVTLTPISAGVVEFSISIPPGQGDLLGFFGNRVTESQVGAMTVSSADGLITGSQFQANKVTMVGPGNTMAPVKNWDFGLRISRNGSPGGVIESVTFRLNGPSLTVADLINASNSSWRFGVRIQSTAGPEGSSKMGLALAQPPDSPPSDPPTIHISSPVNGLLTQAGSVLVTGTVTGNPTSVTLTRTAGEQVSSVAASVSGGNFSTNATLLEGGNVLVATATNAAGSASDQVTVDRDTTPPVVVIAVPQDGLRTTAVSTAVSGTVTDLSPIQTFRIGGDDVTLAEGSFATERNLALGSNTISAIAVDAAGNTGTAQVQVIRGDPPQVQIGSPLAGALVNTPSLTVTGTAPGATAVTVNGVAATLSGGSFSALVTLIEGTNQLTAVATNDFGTDSDERSVTLDNTPPEVVFLFPEDGATTLAASVPVIGAVFDANPITSFSLNGDAVTLGGAVFVTTRNLASGSNSFTGVAVDAAGNSGSAQLHVIRGALPQIEITSPTDRSFGNTALRTVSGTVSGATQGVRVNGVVATVTSSTFSAQIPLVEGANAVTAVASNEYGDASDSISITLDTVPPRVEILVPEDGQQVGAAELFVTGQVFDTSPIAALSLNGEALEPSNSFGSLQALAPGANPFSASATDAAGNVGTDSASAVRVAQPLVIEIREPYDQSGTNSEAARVSGIVGVRDGASALETDDLGEPRGFEEGSSFELEFAGGFTFPFFGAQYASVFVNEAGSISFGAPDPGTGSPLQGPPRILPLFTDFAPGFTNVWVRQQPGELLLTWTGVRADPQTPGEALFDTALAVQLRLRSDGTISIGGEDPVGLAEAWVGISPGGTPAVSLVDLSASEGLRSGAQQAVAEHFETGADYDLGRLFAIFHPDGAGYQLELQGLIADPSVQVDVAGVHAAVSGDVFSTTVPLAVGANHLVATAVNAVDTATDSVDIERELVFRAGERLVLIDDERQPSAGFGSGALFAGEDASAFRGYLDASGVPAASFSPAVGVIQTSGANQIFGLNQTSGGSRTLVTLVFKDLSDDLAEFPDDQLPIAKVRAYLIHPLTGQRINETSRPVVESELLPLAELANTLTFLGVDPSLAGSLIPGDFTPTHFAAARFPLCGPSDGGEHEPAWVPNPRGKAELLPALDEGEEEEPIICLRGLVQLESRMNFAPHGDSLPLLVDEQGPQPLVSFPPAGGLVGGNRVTVRGRLSDRVLLVPDAFDTGASAFEQVQYELFDESGPVPVLRSSGTAPAIDGRFELPGLPLSPGAKRLVLRAVDAGGNLGESVVRFSADLSGREGNAAPQIFSAPVLEATQGAAYLYDVKVRDANEVDLVAFSLSRAPAGMTIEPVSGHIAWTPTDAQVGSHVVKVVASDGDMAAVQTFTVTVTNVNDAPQIVSTPPLAAREGSLYLYGVRAEDHDPDDALEYSLEEAPPRMAIDAQSGRLTWTPRVEDIGSQSVRVHVTDSAGLFDTQSYSINVGAGLRIQISSPADGTTTGAASTTISGSVSRAGASVEINGTSVALSGNEFSLSGVPLALGPNLIRVVAALGGDSALATATVLREGPQPSLPPDPATVAPPLDVTVSTTTFEGTAFLYSGPAPIQSGVDPVDIEPVRAALLRGRVLTLDGGPLPGVRVRILDHPEYGETLSRSGQAGGISSATGEDLGDGGRFDLVVNGGGTLTVVYEKAGFISAQRSAPVDPQSYTMLPEVVLVPYDAAATSVALGGSTPVVHEASASTDSTGERHAALLFPSGLSADLVLPDGTRTSPPSGALTVRATELSRGSRAEQALAGSLPPGMQLVYAVELSADEAIGAGVNRVEFSQRIPLYVENHLGFPVGTLLAQSSYDPARAIWVPERNAQVIEVIDVVGGSASVDSDGDGTVDDILDLPAAERSWLGSRYTPGAQLVRTNVSHFSIYAWMLTHEYKNREPGYIPVDWPGNNPERRTLPLIEPERLHGDEACLNLSALANQQFRLPVPVTGCTFDLNYSNESQKGDESSRAFNVNVTGSFITDQDILTRVHVDLSLAGRLFRFEFPPDPDLSFRFMWDGQDAFGRSTQGAQKIDVDIYYFWQTEYIASRCPEAQDCQPLALSPGYEDDLLSTGNAFTFDPATKELEVSSIWLHRGEHAGGFDPKGLGLGGMTTSELGAYDFGARSVAGGSGGSQTPNGASDVISTVAGGGDGGGTHLLSAFGVAAAGSADVDSPASVVVGRDGSLWVSNIDSGTVVRIPRGGGPAELMAGGGESFCEECPATETVLFEPQGIALAPDGTLYIAESGAGRVRHVLRSGLIETVAGTGVPGDDNQAGPARLAQLQRPSAVAVSRSGRVFILDIDTDTIGRQPAGEPPVDGTRVLMLLPSGRLQPIYFEGITTPCFDDFTKPVNRNLAIDGEDNLYLAQGCRVLRIRPNGAQEVIAGGGSIQVISPLTPPVLRAQWGYSGDGELALKAFIDAQWIAVAPDKHVYIADSRFCGGCVRRIDPDGGIQTVVGGDLARTPNGEFVRGFAGDGGSALSARFASAVVPAVGQDGSLYLADTGNGRVRRVASPLPGFTGTGFAVADPAGGETRVFDFRGKLLESRHPVTGANSRIFDYDGAGLVRSVEDGDGGEVRFERTGSGELGAIVSAFGNRTEIDLDEDGYISRITNPEGEAVELTYAAGGLLEELRQPEGGTSHFEYDEAGRLVLSSGPGGDASGLSRQAEGNLIEVNQATALGNTHTLIRSGAKGALRTRPIEWTQISPWGAQQSISWDGKAERTTITPDGTQISDRLSVDPLSPQGRYVSLERVELPGGLAKVIERRRAVERTDPSDPASAIARISDVLTINGVDTTRAYDAQSRELFVESSQGRVYSEQYDEKGRLIERRIGDLFPERFGYDSRGRLSEIRQGAGADERISILSYDERGFLSEELHPLGRAFRFVRDDAGRATRITVPNGRPVNFIYNDNGVVTSIAPPGRPAHLFAYAADDRLEEYVPPALDGSDPRTLYSFDGERKLASIRRPDGTQLRFSRTAGRLSEITTARGVTSYRYRQSTGQLERISAAGGQELLFSYDGPLLTSTVWSGPIAGSVGFSYDANFRRLTQAVNGDLLGFEYDTDGFLVGAGSMTVSRDAETGLVFGTNLGTVSTAQERNGFGEVFEENARIGASALYANEYTRDLLGRITRKVETLQGVTTIFDYGYDAAGRLATVHENGSGTASYGYDANGNRLSRVTPQGVTSGVYDAQDRLLTYGATAYQWTAAGDLVAKSDAGNGTTTAYTYDAFGNLMRADLPNGQRLDYEVDGQNRRVGKRINGVLVRAWLYQSPLNPVAELDASGQRVARFVYATRLNVPDYMIKGGTTYRILSDHLGSPRLVVNTSSGAVVQRMDYDEFGRVVLDTSPGFQPFGFAGGLYDPDTGLVRFGARDYSPEVGRWTTKDPVLFLDGTNLYQYAALDPINGLDPTGLTRMRFDISEGKLKVDPQLWGQDPYIVDATSGKGSSMNNPDDANLENQGPIPPGSYEIDILELSDPSFLGDLMRQARGDWGDWRVRLHRVGGEPTSRDEFFLHGGFKPGSKGCIDIGGGLLGSVITDRIQSDLRMDPDGRIPVTVVP